jgi:hypothetical protein
VVQVHYDEGLAIHIGPESCGGIREDVVEALTGERIGQPLSRESVIFPEAHVFEITEGTMGERAIASAFPLRRGLRPWHVRKLFAREPGDLGFDRRLDTVGPRREGEEP